VALFHPFRLFISYRRSDAEAIARSLCEALKARLGEAQVFFDTSSIPFGEDFRRIVRERIRASDAVLVVIGPGWLEARDARGPRLWQADDPVAFELRTALESGRRIVPLLVGGAEVPAPEQLPADLRGLPFLNMPRLRAEAFDRDVNALYRQLVGEADDITLVPRLRAVLLLGFPAGALLAALLLAATWTGVFSLFGLDAQVQRLLLASTDRGVADAVFIVRLDAASERALGRPYAAGDPAWRLDHARLVDVAARGGARALAFDLLIKDARPGADAVLAAAVQRAARREPPMAVVFGVSQLEGGAPALAPLLRASGARWGSVCLVRHGGALWAAPLAVLPATANRGDATVVAERPALALAALAPGPLLEADVDRRELRFAAATPDPPLRYSAVAHERAGRCIVAPGDDALEMLLRIAPAGHWGEASRSASYADVLGASGGATPWHGKVVLVGQTELAHAPAEADRHVVQDGFTPRSVFGVELQADAIATLASGRVPRLPTAGQQLATTLGAAALGAAGAVGCYAWPRRRRGVVLAGLGVALSALAAWLARSGFLLDLVNAWLSLGLAALAVRAIQTLARRHLRFGRPST
jgi:CHASE2 domain-containing sensor protein